MEFKPTNPPAYVLSPIWKLSPKHDRSNLLDSYELQEVTKQLNRAIRASNGRLTPRSSYLRSPFYSHRLDQIYKENAKTSKKISSLKRNNGAGESTTGEKGTRGFVLRLWKKVKQGVIRGNKFHS
ncbi:hypothetical protein CDL12_08831 [Handroanthus impetiginosus]|uniref:Uncharacterized protein n=1 Tax=Handroanthus impetiginosus TaxID=429701 RepID=A0A2G9HLS9_9LAMI|nr:hypothetical protein CDL12_08831 [Handroanthus impetiginosus]